MIFEDLFKDLYFWWPVHIDYHNKTNGDWRVEVIVGSILTQNTRWNIVEKVIKNMIKNKFVFDMKFFKEINLDILRNIIRPVSFYNKKAERIKGFFNHIYENYKDLNEFLKLDNLREELLRIKGIGKETADVIVLYAAEKPNFVIDKYTIKYLEKFNIKGSYENLRRFIESYVKDNLEFFEGKIINVLEKIDCKDRIFKAFGTYENFPLNPCDIKRASYYEKLIIVFKELHAQIDMCMKHSKLSELEC